MTASGKSGDEEGYERVPLGRKDVVQWRVKHEQSMAQPGGGSSKGPPA